MKTVVVNEIKTVEERKTKKENLYLFLTVIFMGTGFLAPLIGMVLAVVHSILDVDVLFNTISIVLFVISIPLLFIGSHFMDAERERRKLQKQKDFQRKIKV